MSKVTVKVNVYPSKKEALKKASKAALGKTAEAIVNDITARQVNGDLTSVGSIIQMDDMLYRILYATPYANQLYWHPEHRFEQDKSPDTQDKWMDYYISGPGLEWVIDTYMTFFKQEAGGIIK